MKATYNTDRPRVDSVKIVREQDTDSDFGATLGTYSSTPGPDDRTIDREKRGDMRRNEHRYFIAAMSGDDTGNPDSVEQDYQRAEQISRGELCMYGVYAVAEVSYPIDHDSRRIERFRSGGLWGIESGDYFAKVEQEQIDDLKAHLERFNIDTSNWSEIVDRY